MAEVELTILMPCLNEEQTVVQCVKLARQFLEESGVCGEVLIADNGSSDNSAVLAENAGARVIRVTECGIYCTYSLAAENNILPRFFLRTEGAFYIKAAPKSC